MTVPAITLCPALHGHKRTQDRSGSPYGGSLRMAKTGCRKGSAGGLSWSEIEVDVEWRFHSCAVDSTVVERRRSVATDAGHEGRRRMVAGGRLHCALKRKRLRFPLPVFRRPQPMAIAQIVPCFIAAECGKAFERNASCRQECERPRSSRRQFGRHTGGLHCHSAVGRRQSRPRTGWIARTRVGQPSRYP